MAPPKGSRPPARKKRGRPSLSKKRANDDAHEDNPRPRKRGRPSLADKTAETAAASNNTPEGQPRPRKRGRPSLEDQRAREAAAEDAQPDQPKRKRKRGRPSLQNLTPTEAQNKAPDAPASGKKTGSAKGKNAEAQKQTKKRRGRPSGGPMPSDTLSRDPPRRRSTQHAPGPDEDGSDKDDDEPPASPPRPYLHVAPTVRRVRQATIDAKWQPLPPAALAAATSALSLAQAPVLQRLSGTQRRRTHADAAVRLVAQRVSRKAQRGLPFPPAAASAQAADELDLEAVIDGRAAAERQLEPALHAVELLGRERRRVAAELERDYAMLRDLEGRARAQARETRGLLKRAHVLAPEARAVKEEDDEDDKAGLVFSPSGTAQPGNAFKDLEDGELKTLATQLGGHVESIGANLRQAEGVAPQLERSRAALRAALFRHLDPAQYDKVVLG